MHRGRLTGGADSCRGTTAGAVPHGTGVARIISHGGCSFGGSPRWTLKPFILSHKGRTLFRPACFRRMMPLDRRRRIDFGINLVQAHLHPDDRLPTRLDIQEGSDHGGRRLLVLASLHRLQQPQAGPYQPLGMPQVHVPNLRQMAFGRRLLQASHTQEVGRPKLHRNQTRSGVRRSGSRLMARELEGSQRWKAQDDAFLTSSPGCVAHSSGRFGFPAALSFRPLRHTQIESAYKVFWRQTTRTRRRGNAPRAESTSPQPRLLPAHGGHAQIPVAIRRLPGLSFAEMDCRRAS
jgi:hypothetical protein